MGYAELAPTAALRPWVECFWTRRDDAPRGEQRVLPDGCADLVFDLRSGESDVVGTMTRPLVLPPGDGSDFLGVRFRPGRAATFLRIPLVEITDAQVSLGDLWKGWSGSLLEQPVGRIVAAMESELLGRLDPDRDRRVDAAVERLIDSRGAARVEELAREIGISRQHLARQFLHHVGVSPKSFARVMRFRGVIESLGDDPDWADAAAAHGYYDQSHLIAEFRELAGTTPGAFHFSNR
ncbi:MAG TPA: AraC family transcriptional regulator [Thermoanaerobaculia bacterium]|nr:AraC family transcriptional regulator [Thermoanaerobaculia bacterium]